MSLLIRYQKHCETQENHKDEQLKTHYYKGTFQQVFGVVEKMVRQNPNYQIVHISKEHGELSVNIHHSFLIITIIAVKPLEVAVDLHISTESFSIIGTYPSLKKEIVTFYQTLNKEANLIRP